MELPALWGALWSKASDGGVSWGEAAASIPESRGSFLRGEASWTGVLQMRAACLLGILQGQEVSWQISGRSLRPWGQRPGFPYSCFPRLAQVLLHSEFSLTTGGVSEWVNKSLNEREASFSKMRTYLHLSQLGSDLVSQIAVDNE